MKGESEFDARWVGWTGGEGVPAMVSGLRDVEEGLRGRGSDGRGSPRRSPRCLRLWKGRENAVGERERKGRTGYRCALQRWARESQAGTVGPLAWRTSAMARMMLILANGEEAAVAWRKQSGRLGLEAAEQRLARSAVLAGGQVGNGLDNDINIENSRYPALCDIVCCAPDG